MRSSKARARVASAILACLLAAPALAQLPLLDSLSRDPTDDAAYGRMPFDSLTDLPTTCAVGYCIRGLVDTLGVITFDCMPCSGVGAPTPTPPAATLTATPTPTINVCGEIPNCITPTPTPTVTVTPTATSTPPPSATATPAWCSIVGTCETSTPAPTVTPGPCETVAGWDIGGLYGLPGQCKSLLTYTPTPTATPTATETIPPPSPTPTVGLRMVFAGPTVGESTPGPARWRFLWWDDIQNPYGGVATPTPDGAPFATPSTLCATVGPFVGGLAGINPPVCLPTNVATPTPWGTPAVVCATVGPFLGGLAGVNPPVCLPTNVPTPTPVPSPTGDFVRKDSAAPDPQSMANPLEITFPAAGSTPGLVMLPSSEPGVGEEMFAIYPRSSRDPIMQVQSQTDTGTVRTHHVGFRLDRGTDTGSFSATNPSKPIQFIIGTATSPLSVNDGMTGLELSSVVTFADVDLELGNIQSYIVVPTSNTNPFYSTGISSNLTLEGSGGDGAAWTVSGVPASGFAAYISLEETGSIERHATGFRSKGFLGSAGGTASKVDYFGFWAADLDKTCTSPGTCSEILRVGGYYVADQTVGASTLRYSLLSDCPTCQLRHPGPLYVGSPTPTTTPTTTAATVTPTSTLSPTPTTTQTAASPTPTSASPTPTPAPARTEVPHTVFQNDVRFNGAVINLPQTIKIFEGSTANNAQRYGGGGSTPNLFCSPIALPMPFNGCAERLVCSTNGAPFPGNYEGRFVKIEKRQFNAFGVAIGPACTFTGVANPNYCVLDFAPESVCWNAEDRLCWRVQPFGITPATIGMNCTLTFRQR